MKLADTIKVYAGGPGSGCHGENCGRPSSHTDVKEEKTMAGWRRTYQTSAGEVHVQKFKPITRGQSTSYRVTHPDGKEKVFKLGYGADEKVNAYVKKHFGIEDGNVVRPVADKPSLDWQTLREGVGTISSPKKFNYNGMVIERFASDHDSAIHKGVRETWHIDGKFVTKEELKKRLGLE